MKKLLIFGKNGQIGSNIVKLLKNEKFFDVRSYSSKDIDFSNLDNFKLFLKNISSKPDIIINCAAYTNVDKAEEERALCDAINHKAVKEIADFCRENDIILIQYSTDYVFNGHGNIAFKTSNKKDLSPLNHYGKTKLLAEKAIQDSSCKYIIFRISWIYDFDAKFKNFYNTIKKLAKEKEVLSIIDDQVGSPTRADFIAFNTIKIIKKIDRNPKKYLKKIFHLNDGRYISWYDFAIEIIENLRNSGEKLLVKEIKKIKSFEYKTLAIRPLNSRLYPSFISIARFNIIKVFFQAVIKKLKRNIEKKKEKFACKFLKISKEEKLKLEKIKKEFPEIMSLNETLDYIISNQSSICRFGDGELGIANFLSPNNSYQKSSELLTKRLNEVIKTKISKDLLICISPINSPKHYKNWYKNLPYWEYFYLNNWDSIKHMFIFKRYGNALISRDSIFYEASLKRIKSVWNERDVVFVVGKNGRFVEDQRLFDNIKSKDYVYVRASHAFEDYDKILEECLKFPKNKLFFISAGPTATVLAFDLHQAGYQALDFGHLPNCYHQYLKEKKSPESLNVELIN